jgi:hypothetical protein
MIAINLFDAGRAATGRERLAVVLAHARRCGFHIVTADTLPAPGGARRTETTRHAMRRR